MVPQGLRENIPELICLCLIATYFPWNNEYYEQTGVATRSPLSSTEISMEKFKEEIVQSVKQNAG